jgi:hypothetical protein
MALTVKKITLWRREMEEKPGALAEALEPLSEGGADLQVVMGYRYPGPSTKAAVEVYPIATRKLADAARRAGLAPSSIPALLVEGDNRAGLGHAFSRAIADSGISMNFLVANVVGRRYSAVVGFDSDADATQAASVIKKAAAAAARAKRR